MHGVHRLVRPWCIRDCIHHWPEVPVCLLNTMDREEWEFGDRELGFGITASVRVILLDAEGSSLFGKGFEGFMMVAFSRECTIRAACDCLCRLTNGRSSWKDYGFDIDNFPLHNLEEGKEGIDNRVDDTMGNPIYTMSSISSRDRIACTTLPEDMVMVSSNASTLLLTASACSEISEKWN